MAIVHALLALSSFAVVLTAGTVQAQGRRKDPSLSHSLPS
jgi:hypothetical protein